MEATMCISETQAEQAWLKWTARAFLEIPSNELLKAVSALPSPQLLCSHVARSTAEQVEEMAGNLLDSGEDAAHKLAVEFTQLYCSCSEDAPYPYESVYVDDKRLLMRPVHDEVAALYQKAGFVAANVCATEPEDHLGIELEFVAFSIERGKTTEIASFVDKHLAWVSRFYQETEQRAQSKFYPAAAQLARALANDALTCSAGKHSQAEFSSAASQLDHAMASNTASSR